MNKELLYKYRNQGLSCKSIGKLLNKTEYSIKHLLIKYNLPTTIVKYKEKVLINCANCNKETYNPKYCSKSCSAIITGRLFPKRKTTRKCTKCDSIVKSYRHNLCSLHHEEYMKTRFDYIKSLTLKEYNSRDSVKKQHASSRNVHVRHYARKVFKHLTLLPCAICYYNKHVELCHIKPISSYDENSTIEQVNDPENIIQLCPNCHWEFDHNLVDLSTIKRAQRGSNSQSLG